MTLTCAPGPEIHDARPWKSMRPRRGFRGYTPRFAPITTASKAEAGPKEEGLVCGEGSIQLLEALGVPRDPRGIVLLCGFVASAAFGIVALLNPPGDFIGFAYLAIAVVGYFFIQTRGLTTFLWLLVAGAGAAAVLAGGAGGWVEFVIGLALATVALTPLPAEKRILADGQQPLARGSISSSQNGGGGRGLSVDSFQSSRKVEDSPTRTSGKAEVGTPRNGVRQLSTEPDLAGSKRSRIAIKSIGRLRISADERDVTGRLNEQPRLEFLFSFLLARVARGDNSGVDRSALADEVAPGFPAGSQRDRLRKQLYALQVALGSELKPLLRVNNTEVRLELDGVDTDFGRLLDASRLLARRRTLLDPVFADQIRGLLDDTLSGEFLSSFSEVEHQVTEGRGGASQVVEEARTAIAGQRAELARALAEYYDASGHPQSSIAYLRAALAGSPARQDLARLLVAAYMRTGQTALADQARLEFDLTEEK